MKERREFLFAKIILCIMCASVSIINIFFPTGSFFSWNYSYPHHNKFQKELLSQTQILLSAPIAILPTWINLLQLPTDTASRVAWVQWNDIICVFDQSALILAPGGRREWDSQIKVLLTPTLVKDRTSTYKGYDIGHRNLLLLSSEFLWGSRNVTISPTYGWFKSS